MKKILETQRLYLREMTINDAENAYELNLDKEVIKYTGDVSFESVEEAKTFLMNYTHYKDYGFGRWAVIDKSNEAFLGWCGLKFTAKLNEYDIGFRFIKRYWNQGFATEAAKACIDYGFNELNINTILGRAMKENLASIHVLKKIGLVYDRDEECGDFPGVIYKIENGANN